MIVWFFIRFKILLFRWIKNHTPINFSDKSHNVFLSHFSQFTMNKFYWKFYLHLSTVISNKNVPYMIWIVCDFSVYPAVLKWFKKFYFSTPREVSSALRTMQLGKFEFPFHIFSWSWFFQQFYDFFMCTYGEYNIYVYMEKYFTWSSEQCLLVGKWMKTKTDATVKHAFIQSLEVSFSF